MIATQIGIGVAAGGAAGWAAAFVNNHIPDMTTLDGLLVSPDVVGAAIGASITIIGAQVVGGMRERAQAKRHIESATKLIGHVDKMLENLCVGQSNELMIMAEMLRKEREATRVIGGLIPLENLPAHVAWQYVNEELDRVIDNIDGVIMPIYQYGEATPYQSVVDLVSRSRKWIRSFSLALHD